MIPTVLANITCFHSRNITVRPNDAKASPIEGKDEIVTERGKDMRDFDW